MKPYPGLLLAALLPVTAASAQPAAPAKAPAGDPLLEAVRGASDPSLAIEAYARASAAGTIAPVILERIYVQHMVDHGAPELADAQARDLIRRSTADATVLGVAAYNDASRGNVREAIHNLKLALTGRPADPFLLRTAGQILAWYDANRSRSGLSKEDVTAIESLRAAGKSRPEFGDAYRMASEAQQPSTTATTPVPATQPSSSGGTSTVQSSGSEYASGGSGSYYPYYYSPYYGYAYGSAYSAIALRDRDFHRDVRDPRNSPMHPGDPARNGPAPAHSSGSPRPAPAQAPARPPQAPARAPAPPPGPPHP